MTKSEVIKAKAISLGFLSCGISKADFLEDEAPHLEQWLKQGYNADLGYMERNFDMRLNPKLLVDDAKSVISLTHNYYNPQKKEHEDSPNIAMYAWGEDYHTVVKDKGFLLLQFIKENFGEVNARVFTDSAPVLEKAWAVKSGLGWQGKNSNVLIPKKGSYYFLAEIILDLDLDYDNPIGDKCGKCKKCIDACPTQAIMPHRHIDANRCISYLTIENKGYIPSEFKGKMENNIFGCDICQQVCPWNRFSESHTESKFLPKDKILTSTKEDWQNLTEEQFKIIFKNSPVKRSKYSGLKRNIDFLF